MGNEASSTATSALHNIQSELEARADQAGQQWRSMKARAAQQNGNGTVSSHEEDGQQNGLGEGEEEEEEAAPTLTPEQIEVIKSTWLLLHNQITSIGVLTFLHLFTQHPEAKSSFKKFHDMAVEELRDDEIFAQHAGRVMRVIEKVVDRIDDPPSYRSYLSILGQKHAWYEAEPQYLDQMGYMFLAAIQPILEKEIREMNLRLDRVFPVCGGEEGSAAAWPEDEQRLYLGDRRKFSSWSDSVSDAWEQLFVVIVHSMRKAMEKELMEKNG